LLTSLSGGKRSGTWIIQSYQATRQAEEKEIKILFDQGPITQGEHERKRAEILGEL